jgi:hypothetical protein
MKISVRLPTEPSKGAKRAPKWGLLAVLAPFVSGAGIFEISTHGHFRQLSGCRLRGYGKFRSRSHRAVIRVFDAGSPTPVSTCNAGWRTPGPSSLPPTADRLPPWAPQ